MSISAKPRRLRSDKIDRFVRYARRKGMTPAELAESLILEYGSALRIAQKLHVAPNTVRFHLLRSGIHYVNGKWTKVSQS